MKIFNNNLKKYTRTAGLQKKLLVINNMKYLPAFSKEWKNIIYSFNKNNIKNIAVNTVNINKIIKSYFNLFFKNRKFLGRTKFVHLKKRRHFLRRIFVSSADIKYTNNNAKLTLYTINKERKALKRRYYKLNKKLSLKLFKSYAFLYNNYIKNIFLFLDEKYKTSSNLFFVKRFINKKKYVDYKIQHLHTSLKLNHLALKKMWSLLIQNQSSKYFTFLRKYNLLYALNQFKFNKLRLLSKLTYLLEKIIGRKIEFNIVNLKSITHHPDIFTDLLALKIKKDRASPRRRMNNILHKARIPEKNTIQERSIAFPSDKIDLFRNKHRDLKVISLISSKRGMNKSKSLTTVINRTNTKDLHNTIFNSIGYKNLSGIKLKVSGRLTKRYRADRAIQALKWKGGLKNIDSSFKKLSTVSFRGNTNSNVSYSWTKSKRRIGSFAVKGWIGGK